MRLSIRKPHFKWQPSIVFDPLKKQGYGFGRRKPECVKNLIDFLFEFGFNSRIDHCRFCHKNNVLHLLYKVNFRGEHEQEHDHDYEENGEGGIRNYEKE